MRMLQLVIVGAVALLLSSCGSKPSGSSTPAAQAPAASGAAPAKDKEKPAEAAKLVKLDLSKAGEVDSIGEKKAPWQLTIEAPEGATAKLAFFNSQIHVESGKGFYLAIIGFKADLAYEKKKLQDVDKKKFFKGFVVDTPDTLMWEMLNPIEQALGKEKIVYQFVTNIKVGDKDYSCETQAANFDFSRAEADLMLKCAKTLAAK